MANAHRNRHGNVPDCIYCQHRPKEARRLRLYRNKNGNRHNPASNNAGKHNETHWVHNYRGHKLIKWPPFGDHHNKLAGPLA